MWLSHVECKRALIHLNLNRRSSNALFSVLWHADGSVSFRANNGKLLGTKRSGHLFANCADDGSEEELQKTRFYFYLVNRPVLVLKCEQGFVGAANKSGAAGANRLECNRANYETIRVEREDRGAVHFKGETQVFGRWRILNNEKYFLVTFYPSLSHTVN